MSHDTEALKALVAKWRNTNSPAATADKAQIHCSYELDKSLERLLASPDANRQAWLPIETAPKDGSWVLGYYPVTPLKVWPMCWCEGTGEFETPSSLWAKTGKLQYEPTHWMPLPQPPDANNERTAPSVATEDAIMAALIKMAEDWETCADGWDAEGDPRSFAWRECSKEIRKYAQHLGKRPA